MTKNSKSTPKLDKRSLVILSVLSIVFGGLFAAGYYQYSFTQFKSQNIKEKETILQLVTAFVSTYSEHRKNANTDHLPVPATFRAKALAQYNKNSNSRTSQNSATKVEMIGVPGLEIANAGKDDHIKSLVTALAKNNSKSTWRGFTEVAGITAFRFVKPIAATKDSCITCHNKIQAGHKTWVKGEIMGAYVMDAPAAAFFNRLYRNTGFLALLASVSIMLIGLLVLRSFAAQTERQQQAKRQQQRVEDLKAAREQAEKEALSLSQQVTTINEELTCTNDQLVSNLRELQNANEQLVKSGKMAQLGQLTATVAHEIRNPLGTIRSSAFLLERKYGESNPKMAKPITRITSAVVRCDNIISELLDFSRTRTLTYNKENFDEWLLTIVNEQMEKIPQSVAVECHLGLDDKLVEFDKDHLSRAVINFISNASEAMVGKNALPEEITTTDPKIIISSQFTQQGVALSVEDNGPGISEENLKKIFEPLFTTKSFGIGLGLPAVEKIFEQHGGYMEVSASPSGGAKFTGWIPQKTTQNLAA